MPKPTDLDRFTLGYKCKFWTPQTSISSQNRVAGIPAKTRSMTKVFPI